MKLGDGPVLTFRMQSFRREDTKWLRDQVPLIQSIINHLERCLLSEEFVHTFILIWECRDILFGGKQNSRRSAYSIPAIQKTGSRKLDPVLRDVKDTGTVNCALVPAPLNRFANEYDQLLHLNTVNRSFPLRGFFFRSMHRTRMWALGPRLIITAVASQETSSMPR